MLRAFLMQADDKLALEQRRRKIVIFCEEKTFPNFVECAIIKYPFHTRSLKHLLYDLICRLLGWLQMRLASLRGRPPQGDDRVVHRRRRHRLYVDRQTAMRWGSLVGVVLCGVMFLVGAVKLIGYGVDYLSARRTSRQLRKVYYDTPTDVPTAASETAAASDLPYLIASTVTPVPEMAPTETPAPAVSETTKTLPTQAYPQNPYNVVSSRFSALRKQNRDIIGWLTIDGLIDEAVVQRDNTYYLDRDYMGYHNVNGAIFLDERVSLTSRPYTLMLYGHNMKTGAMFGNLRNYENLSFYKKNPFITFDTLYEEGRYVIFSVTTVSLEYGSWRYLDLSKLTSSSAEKRQEVLTMLSRASVFSSGVTATGEDQVLLLITCVDDDSERRVVAARRIRDDEDEDSLRKLVQQSYVR